MRNFKNSFVQQFAGGFVIGAVALLSFQPAEATRNLTSRFSDHVAASSQR